MSLRGFLKELHHRNVFKVAVAYSAINTAFAFAVAALVLGNYWPIVKVFDLARPDLQTSSSVSTAHAPAIKTPGGGP
jgi:hypothetical protein